LSTTVLGKTIAAPIVLAPVGLCGMQHGDGEVLSARAANKAGIPFTLSTMSIGSIEDVAEATGQPFWFQLYVIRDRGFSRDLMDRAIAAKCDTLVLTVDLQVLGQRHRDVKNGLTVPPEFRFKNVFDIATKPAWAWSVLKGKRKTFGNISGHVPGMENVNSLSKWTSDQFDPALNWRDVEWIRNYWPGHLIIKGILDVDDARTAVSAGADAIVVSNHGGRQLDGTLSSISMLPPIADAVGADTEVLFDGGVRTGNDIMRALALGARACLIGRAYIYGLGAYGEAGVAKAIDILTKELSVTMALTGVNNVTGIDGHVLAGTSESKPKVRAAARPKPTAA
jgi:L-lactate dehydrogenase (cytochrome)